MQTNGTEANGGNGEQRQDMRITISVISGELRQINCPISCGGVPVMPGDIIVADADGVVVVAREDAETVMQRADTKLSYEAKRRVEINDGQIAKPAIDDLLRKKGVIA